MNRLLIKHSRLACVTLALSAAGAVFAAEPSGWYADIGAGQSHSKIDGAAIDTVLTNQSLGSSSRADGNHGAWKFDVGYQFHPNFAIEAGCVDLGKASWSSNITAPAADTLSGQVHTRGTSIDLVSIAPPVDGVSVYGKLGVVKTNVDFSGSSSGGGGTQVNGGGNKSTVTTFGLGAGYDFTPAIGVKVEWDRYVNAGDANITGRGNFDLASAALVFKF